LWFIYFIIWSFFQSRSLNICSNFSPCQVRKWSIALQATASIQLRVNNNTEQHARFSSNAKYVMSLSLCRQERGAFLKPMCLLKYILNCEQNFSYLLTLIFQHPNQLWPD
jgi:hypothetical protein